MSGGFECRTLEENWVGEAKRGSESRKRGEKAGVDASNLSDEMRNDLESAKLVLRRCGTRSIVIPGASTAGQWQESDLTEAGKLAKNIISNWPD